MNPQKLGKVWQGHIPTRRPGGWCCKAVDTKPNLPQRPQDVGDAEIMCGCRVEQAQQRGYMGPSWMWGWGRAATPDL